MLFVAINARLTTFDDFQGPRCELSRPMLLSLAPLKLANFCELGFSFLP